MKVQPPPSPQVVRFAQQPQTPQAAMPMAPTQKQQLKQQPPSKQQVDSSLFVTTPSLRRVEPNPAESPLKRTKLSEDDAMEFALGFVELVGGWVGGRVGGWLRC